MAEALENGHAARKAEKKVARLKTALEQSKEAQEKAESARDQSNAENSDLKAVLQAVNTEITTLRAEREKQGEKEGDIRPIQLKILRRLPSAQSGRWLKITEIARSVNIPVDEAEIHTDVLKDAGLAIMQPDHRNVLTWHRTSEGNRLVYAMRLAGDEEGGEKEEIKVTRSKHGKLTHPEEIALVTMAERPDEGATEPEIAKALEYTAAQTAFILLLLSQKTMAVASSEPDYGTGVTWYILNNGLEHLAERKLLP